MLIFKNKKIFIFSFLILSLISYLLPVSGKAQALTSNAYYYIIKSTVGVDAVYGPFTDQSSCVTDQNLKTTGAYGAKYTQCKNINKTDSSTITESDFTASGTSNSVETIPWSTVQPSNYKLPGQGDNTPVANTDYVYYPLAPLPGIGDANNSNAVNTGAQKCTTTAGKQTCIPCPVGAKAGECTPGPGFGGYLNAMINLFIGLCAVLAMLMIIMGGIQYVTSELISSKEEGKQRITQAILGLLLALGSYAILNTINKDLLNINLGDMKAVSIQIQDEDETQSSVTDGNSCTVGATAGTCSQGLASVAGTNFVLCKSISDNVAKMVTAAKAAGYDISSGGSCRSASTQKNLRVKNCGDTSSNSCDVQATKNCKPLTACPGTSMHESGLAIDFKCSGTLITSTTNPCFVWLQANAGTYGLQNLKTGTEPWHWSTTGK